MTAAAAAIVAIMMMIGAVLRRRRANRAYRAALDGAVGPPPQLTTGGLVLDAVRWPARLAAFGLAIVVVSGAALAVRWQTEGPPSTGVRVIALRPEVLGHHPGKLTGVPSARPVLRRILRQMPSDFVSVGVHPGKGLVIHAPAWVDADSPTTSDPSLALVPFEIEVMTGSFAGLQGQIGLHIGAWDETSMSGSLRPPPMPHVQPDRVLRREIAARLHPLGLHIVSLRITHPYGPLAIAVTRTRDPRRYIERTPPPLDAHITWGALIIEDTTGTVRAVYTTRIGRFYPEAWVDPRLFPAQPSAGGPIPPPPLAVEPAAPLRAPRA